MNLLIFAHKNEAIIFLEEYSFTQVEFSFQGLFKNKGQYLLITGEGPINALSKTMAVLIAFKHEIKNVINLGIAGSLNNKINKFDIIKIRTLYAEHADRLQFKSYTTELKETTIDCITVFDRVLDRNHKEKLSPVAEVVDREAWAIAQVCQLISTPFFSYKVVSDNFDEENFCDIVKENARHFSQLLFQYYAKEISTINNQLTDELDLTFSDKNFYFTVTQKRIFNKMLQHFKLLKIDFLEFFHSENYIKIKSKENSPKEKTKMLLELMDNVLYPEKRKIRNKINKSLFPLLQNDIIATHDPNFEDTSLKISFNIKTQNDLDEKIQALKNYKIDTFSDIMKGDF
jgi:nucleoside phosphorylase